MNANEITFEDLLADEPACATSPMTFKQLLADGFPYQGGPEALSAIQRMPDPGPELERWEFRSPGPTSRGASQTGRTR